MQPPGFIDENRSTNNSRNSVITMITNICIDEVSLVIMKWLLITELMECSRSIVFYTYNKVLKLYLEYGEAK